MHPAPSIIVFTVLSGLGFGLLAWLGLGYPGVTGWTALAFLAIGFGLALAGLAASAFHLGNPQRALRAFSQWQTSWLSREAWLAAAALAVMGIYGLALVVFGARLTALGWLGAGLSLATVLATSMIYGQLKTVPRWNTLATPLCFLAFSVAGGALLAGQVSAALLLILLAGGAQILAWRMGDGALARSGTTLATATGLGDRGNVRAFEPPHTGPNYLLREMVHVVGRKHAEKLRIIGFVLAIAAPVVLLLLPFSHALAAVAVLCHLAGMVVLRWLFFAEAEHVVGLYYGKR